MPWKQPKLTSQEWVVASPHSRTGARLARVYKEDEQPSPWTAGHLGGHYRSSGTPVAWHPSPSEQRSRRQRSPDCAWLPSERPPSHFWLTASQAMEKPKVSFFFQKRRGQVCFHISHEFPLLVTFEEREENREGRGTANPISSIARHLGKNVWQCPADVTRGVEIILEHTITFQTPKQTQQLPCHYYLLLASSYCRLSLTFSAKCDLLLTPI